MKRFIALITLFITSMPQAATPIDGWYTSISGGYLYIPGNIDKTINQITYNNANYQPGFDVGGTFGYQNTPMRYELEVTYLDANINSFTINRLRATEPSGYNNGIMAMANVFYDFPAFIEPIKPFLGVGIGYDWVHMNINGNIPGTLGNFSSSNNLFAYQAMAGLTFNFAENYALTIGYRYNGTATNVYSIGDAFQAQTANVGALYRFDEGRYQ